MAIQAARRAQECDELLAYDLVAGGVDHEFHGYPGECVLIAVAGALRPVVTELLHQRAGARPAP
jgi:hypothetical protein